MTAGTDRAWAAPAAPASMPPWAGGEVPQWHFGDTEYVSSEPHPDVRRRRSPLQLLAPLAVVLAIGLVVLVMVLVG